jgi:hypothetical protein
MFVLIEPGLEALSPFPQGFAALGAKGCWEAPVIPLDHSRMPCGIMAEFKKIMKESVGEACFFKYLFCQC